MRTTAIDLSSSMDAELLSLIAAYAEQRVATDMCARSLPQPVPQKRKEAWYRRPRHEAARVLGEQTLQDKNRSPAHTLTAQIAGLIDDHRHHIALDEAAQVVVEGVAIQIAKSFDVDTFKVKASTTSDAIDQWKRAVVKEQAKHRVNDALCKSGESPEFGHDFLTYAHQRILVDAVVIDLRERFPDNPASGLERDAWYEPSRSRMTQRLAERADGDQTEHDLAVRAVDQLCGILGLDPAGDNELAARLIAEAAAFKLSPLLDNEQSASSKVLDAVVTDWALSMKASLATSVRPVASDLFVVNSSLGQSL